MDHESVSDPESGAEMHLHCVLVMHLAFLKLGYSFFNSTMFTGQVPYSS